MLTQLFIFLLAGVAFLGCDQSDDQPTAIDQAYFPLETGRFVLYDIEESFYSPHSAPVQQHYQLKEVTGAAYANVTGQTAYKIYRYKRLTDNQPWEADSVWSARLTNNEAIRTENGVDIVKLVFPIRTDSRWNDNRYNGFVANDVFIRNAGGRFSVLGKPIDETVTVVIRDDSTLLQQDKRMEVYARQIGLIYAERLYLHFCSESPACIGQNQIETGSRKIVRMQTYGKE